MMNRANRNQRHGYHAAYYKRLITSLARAMVLVSILAGAVYGCAVPIAPSGGPVDDAPPLLEYSDPENGAVNVSTDRIALRFNERLDERSISGALSVFPEFIQPVDIKFKGDSFEIRFPEPLRSNTTYVISLDTRLRDAHSVAVRQPISIAFGTGNNLNTGRVTGKIIDELRGKPVPAADVFLYAGDGAFRPDSLRPVYRTQTDESGDFTLSNLKEDRYSVLGLRDQNHNNLLDRNEPFAIIDRLVETSDSSVAHIDMPLVLADHDQESPEIRQVRSIYADEIALQFSEDVRVLDTDSRNWVLSDSASGNVFRVLRTFSGTGPRDVRLRTDPLSGGTKTLSGRAAVSDSTGNMMVERTYNFRPVQTVRSESVDFVGFLPDTSSRRSVDGDRLLWPGFRAGVQFTTTLDEPVDGVWNERVTVSDTSGTALPFDLRSSDGVRYFVEPDSFDQPFQLAVKTPDSTLVESFIAVGPQLLGEVAGIIEPDSAISGIIVELYLNQVPYPLIRTVEPEGHGHFRFEHLPGGSRYFLRAFVDVDNNRRWTRGNIDPLQAAEPILWYEVAERVRARWETVLPDTLRFIRSE